MQRGFARRNRLTLTATKGVRLKGAKLWQVTSGIGRANYPVRVLCQGAVVAVSNDSFDRQRSIENVGRILEKRKRRCRSWIGIVLRANSKVGFSFEFGSDFPILIRQHSFRMIRLQACPGEAVQRDSMTAGFGSKSGPDFCYGPPG